MDRAEGPGQAWSLPLHGQPPAAADMRGADKELDDEDPYELVAVSVPGPPGYDGPREMARVFIEEYALLGWPRHRILRLFSNPVFAGSHSVYEERGEAYILGLIDEVLGRKGEADARRT